MNTVYKKKLLYITEWLENIAKTYEFDYTIYKDTNEKDLGVACVFLKTNKRIDIHTDINLIEKLLTCWMNNI